LQDSSCKAAALREREDEFLIQISSGMNPAAIVTTPTSSVA
jgi:hypothetical protein